MPILYFFLLVLDPQRVFWIQNKFTALCPVDYHFLVDINHATREDVIHLNFTYQIPINVVEQCIIVKEVIGNRWYHHHRV